MTVRPPTFALRSLRSRTSSGYAVMTHSFGGTPTQDVLGRLGSMGEVGHDLLEVDWRRTPLGEPTEWPLSLRTAVMAVLSSQFSMWLGWGPQLTFVCNESYRRYTLGKKYPWALGRPAREVWAEIWPEVGPRIEHVLRTGHATWDRSLLLFLDRNGYEEETYHTLSYSPLPDDDGAIAGMLCVVTEDTQRVISERQITTLRDLSSVRITGESERGFLRDAAAVLARNPRSLPFTAVYTFDPEGNAHLASTSGLRAGDSAAPRMIAVDDPDQVWPARALASGEHEQLEINDLQERFETLPTGAWDKPPARALLTALPPPAGELPVGFLVVGLNRYRHLDAAYRSFVRLIAQRLATGVESTRTYTAERERAEQLLELDRAKTAFFSNVSHEFRTPLTLMLAPVQDALHEHSALELDQVELVQRNGQRLLKLVNELLDFSRLEAGRLRAEFHPLDVARFTAELAGSFEDACRRAGITLKVVTEPPTEPVYLDPDLWERVVLNLISNAFKATLSGRIEVQLRGEHGVLLLTVTDTGPGIAPRERQRIFERFHRIRDSQSRSHEGAGIGLALVKEIVELHGGRVTVESTLGRGSRFSVRIPLGREHLPAEHVRDQPTQTTPASVDLFAQEAARWLHAVGDEPPAASSTSPEIAAAKVLIVDDNPDLRRYLMRLLSPFWDVQTVGDGARALEIIRKDVPDLVISDLMMPGLNGVELLHELRNSPETQQLPVIMLSARAGEEASIEGLQAGADDYLPKPFSGRELLAHVRSRLELALVRREATENIRAERLLLEQTVRQLPAGVLLLAPSGEVVLANEQVASILGQPLIEASRISESVASRLYLPDRRTHLGAQAPLTRAIRELSVIHDQELAYHAEDGRWITLRVNAAPVIGSQGQVVAGVLVFQDITRQARADRLLAAQRDIMAMIARGEPLDQTLVAIVQAVERLSDHGGRGSIRLREPHARQLRTHAAPSRNSRVCWATPILATDGRTVGTLALYHRKPHAPSSEDRQTVELLSRTAAVAIERARDAELRARQFRELQTSLLPPTLPTVPGLDAAATFHAGDQSLEVGGDFYDLFALDNGAAWGLVVGDVAGHGAQAAAVTALARHTTWAYARLHADPAQVLASVSDALRERSFGRYCTAVYGHIEASGSNFTLLLAVGGHPPPLIRRAGGHVERAATHGPLLGMMAKPYYPVEELTLRPGDMLVLYTDGLIERNPRISGERALAEIVAKLPEATAESALSALQAVALESAQRLRDDVGILILRVPPAAGAPRIRRLSAQAP